MPQEAAGSAVYRRGPVDDDTASRPVDSWPIRERGRSSIAQSVTVPFVGHVVFRFFSALAAHV
eukprot:12371929-Alexandrium_andersonii.AAC.1